ncbi:MAG TPA: chromate transporter [Christensenellaceae bacterium]|nr:chromate transporter [Christensenellaceae bacterium]
MKDEKPAKDKLYSTIFFSTLKLSAFTFGGGYVIVPLMRKRFVEELGWINEEEMLDSISIAQTSPGPIAVNGSLLVGYRLAGFKGAAIATLGSILPPFFIIALVSYFYDLFRQNTYISAAMQGMQAGVAAVVSCTVVDLAFGEGRRGGVLSIFLMAASFVCVYFLKWHVLLIFLISAVISFIHSRINGSKKP